MGPQVNQHGPTAVSESRFRVRYAETDQMAVVYHSNYVIWFGIGRVDLLRQLGFTYKQLEGEDGCSLPVVELRCRYKAPARYDDEILVRTHLKNVRETYLHFGYEVLRASDSALLAEGETVHISTDRAGNKRPFPEKYLKAFKAAVGKG
jgi:acyl-CoA thioester hydrolase